ncbi:putative dNA-binding protein [Parabacteroides distasonis str. 3999B T(B) 4]|nr:putative dNA-binding protein [Parabacteroides distasonis str. 3999B T(B) 4]
MALGYKIKLDGLGIFYNELLTEKSVSTPKEVTAKLVKSIRPAFNAEYTILNGTFRYALLPEKTNLVRIDFKGGVPIVTPEEGDSESPDEIRSPRTIHYSPSNLNRHEQFK